MFINDQTAKFLEERDHYVRRNAKDADTLTDYDFKQIAESAGVSLKIVLEDAKYTKWTYDIINIPHDRMMFAMIALAGCSTSSEIKCYKPTPDYVGCFYKRYPEYKKDVE
ncbi:MAG: hypothetical protein HOH19_07095 [Kordiimonadaceae bacterium]|jgi:hypothetical protein|nr:hypothetical protein [Kordiimonadaceae bacterium]MBT6032324.1 hypothetical protein [Kordiimonadaceae bacterium]